MLKVRLMGTKNDIKWFGKILQRNPKIEVTEFSDLYPNKGTKKFYRAYVEVKKTNVGRPDLGLPLRHACSQSGKKKWQCLFQTVFHCIYNLFHKKFFPFSCFQIRISLCAVVAVKISYQCKRDYLTVRFKILPVHRL